MNQKKSIDDTINSEYENNNKHENDMATPEQRSFVSLKSEYYNSTSSKSYYSKTSYTKQLEDFLAPYKTPPSSLDSRIGEIALILNGKAKRDGKRIWKWEDRLDEIAKIYAENSINYSSSQKKDIERIKNILRKNEYLRKNYKDKIYSIDSILDYKTPAKKKQQKSAFFSKAANYVKKLAVPLIATSALILGIYNYNSLQSGQKEMNNLNLLNFKTEQAIKKSEAKFEGNFSICKLLNTQSSQETLQKKEVVEHTVKKGNTLWGITKKFLTKKMKKAPSAKEIYDSCNNLALENNKGLQKDYSLESKDPKSPHFILPGEIIRIPEWL